MALAAARGGFAPARVCTSSTTNHLTKLTCRGLVETRVTTRKTIVSSNPITENLRLCSTSSSTSSSSSPIIDNHIGKSLTPRQQTQSPCQTSTLFGWTRRGRRRSSSPSPSLPLSDSSLRRRSLSGWDISCPSRSSRDPLGRGNVRVGGGGGGGGGGVGEVGGISVGVVKVGHVNGGHLDRQKRFVSRAAIVGDGSTMVDEETRSVEPGEAIASEAPSQNGDGGRSDEERYRFVGSFQKRLRISDLKGGEDGGVENVGKQVMIKGWVRTVRLQKAFAFVEVNDGSSLSGIQVIVNKGMPGFELIDEGDVTTGASITVEGTVVASPGGKQKIEIKADSVTLVGRSDATTYPLQKKRHSFEYLRTIAHLRPRTNSIGAVSRVRNALAFATHQFFQNNGFVWVSAPIITASDCEGAGEQFCVTTLINSESTTSPTLIPSTKEQKVDWSKDFFKRPAYLTVSGQLNAEIYATALSDVYTFGPTFRAENSNTSRHLAEFWMIEPELAFADLTDDMKCATAYLQHVIQHLLDNCKEDMQFFDKFIEPGILNRLTSVAESEFAHVTYTDAIDILLKSGRSFEFPVEWGRDLQSEHERYITEVVFKGRPVIVTNYPKECKAFYMRENEDGRTVAAMDVLVPTVGELIGGSQREERLEVLESRMEEAGLDKNSYWWYLDLRRYGSGNAFQLTEEDEWQINALQVLDHVEQKEMRTFQLHSAGGNSWIKGWKEVKNAYGASVVEIDGQETKLAKCGDSIEQGSTINVKYLRKWRPKSGPDKKTLIALLRNPRSGQDLGAANTDTLFRLYKAAKDFQQKSTRSYLRWIISRVIKEKTGWVMGADLTVNVRSDGRVRLAEVRKVVNDKIECLGLPECMAK
ncbi:hypothetical protein CBR_g16969 [Chara braunii]|uniref:asparagine--tRNA ligase n=1 Tax=Chara braunii TaxID=69332 RepID=A0A388KU98_CHABU|nr:hypothetical protein CBR_g16969 [Chara braunii]|eukprot:GBG73626.1 hypothetical protein CBR_g16969 [Chara braunii]